jgi:molybdate transport system regulatory protein
MQISARNQFPGLVKAVHKGAVNSDVILDIGDGLEIFANITNEAVADLRLAPGRAAVALIKSSFVMLTSDPNVRTSARNRLTGVVSAVIPGSVNCEVKLQLAGTRVLTAIVTADALKEMALVKGGPCTALVKASHVLVAVD